jgi:hypothetical protein
MSAVRGRGRPAIGAPVNVRLPEDLLAWIDAGADAAGVKRAEFIRATLEAAREQAPGRETKLDRQARRFRAGLIDKWELYESTRHYPAEDVARAIDAPLHVVQTRRRDLRKMVAR